jgi:hypothetical protein
LFFSAHSLVNSSKRHLAEDAKTKKIGIIGMGHVGKDQISFEQTKY